VLKIPAPIRGKTRVQYPLATSPVEYLDIQLPGIEDLPYANQSHFEMLLEMLPVDDIITIFTHLLFEQKTLLVAPKIS
jgi:hypothetical protein